MFGELVLFDFITFFYRIFVITTIFYTVQSHYQQFNLLVPLQYRSKPLPQMFRTICLIVSFPFNLVYVHFTRYQKCIESSFTQINIINSQFIQAFYKVHYSCTSMVHRKSWRRTLICYVENKYKQKGQNFYKILRNYNDVKPNKVVFWDVTSTDLVIHYL